MSHTLTLDLPDELFTFLEKTAKKPVSSLRH